MSSFTAVKERGPQGKKWFLHGLCSLLRRASPFGLANCRLTRHLGIKNNLIIHISFDLQLQSGEWVWPVPAK